GALALNQGDGPRQHGAIAIANAASKSGDVGGGGHGNVPTAGIAEMCGDRKAIGPSRNNMSHRYSRPCDWPGAASSAHHLDMQLESILRCPSCGHRERERMPTDACRFFYE